MNSLDKDVYARIARKDLSFGCLVKTYADGEDEWEYTYVWETSILVQWDCSKMRTIDEWCGCCSEVEKYGDDNSSIIGHPIVLSDVLLYCGNTWNTSAYNIILNGFDYTFEGFTEYGDKICWDLNIPYYEHQREITKDFIRSLVK